MNQLYLSRRNLEALLAKLDAKRNGADTACTVIKNQQPDGAKYNQTMKSIAVTAVEDDEYYGAQNRPAGEMHPREESALNKPSTGVMYGGSPF